MKRYRLCASEWLCGLLLATASLTALAETPGEPIGPGKTVAFEYTLTLADGSVVQSNVGGKPFSYVQGKGQIVAGLEKALVGLQAGDKKKVTVPPEEGYGPVKADARREVPIDRIPEDARKVGAMLSAEGVPGPIRVADVKKDTVLLDFNHPLAGKTLTFDVHIMSVQ